MSMSLGIERRQGSGQERGAVAYSKPSRHPYDISLDLLALYDQLSMAEEPNGSGSMDEEPDLMVRKGGLLVSLLNRLRFWRKVAPSGGGGKHVPLCQT